MVGLTARLQPPLGRVERGYALRDGRYHVTVVWSNRNDRRSLPDGYTLAAPIPDGADVHLQDGKVVPA